MPKITLGITGLPEILGRDYGISLDEAARSRLLLGSTVFCTIAGKSQNLFRLRNRNMRSRLFSYYQGYSILCDDITQNVRSCT